MICNCQCKNKDADGINGSLVLPNPINYAVPLGTRVLRTKSLGQDGKPIAFACGQETDWVPGTYEVWDTKPDSTDEWWDWKAYPDPDTAPKEMLMWKVVLRADFSGEQILPNGTVSYDGGPLEGTDMLEDILHWFNGRCKVIRTA